MLAGFAYEMAYAGIPYQDPTGEMTKQYMRDDYIAMTVIKIGLALLVGGVLLKLFSKRKTNLY